MKLRNLGEAVHPGDSFSIGRQFLPGGSKILFDGYQGGHDPIALLRNPGEQISGLAVERIPLGQGETLELMQQRHLGLESRTIEGEVLPQVLVAHAWARVPGSALAICCHPSRSVDSRRCTSSRAVASFFVLASTMRPMRYV